MGMRERGRGRGTGMGTHRVCGLDIELDKFPRQGPHSAGLVVSIPLPIYMGLLDSSLRIRKSHVQARSRRSMRLRHGGARQGKARSTYLIIILTAVLSTLTALERAALVV